jgi:putative acetyltransferase
VHAAGNEAGAGTSVTPSVRSARPWDKAGILRVVEDAFGHGGTRDPEEELTIVRNTWSATQGPALIELVADEGGTVVGHLQAAPGRLDGIDTPVAGVAPVCVGASNQRRGVGTALMSALIGAAEDQRVPLLVLLGEPAYYGRFGFVAAGPLGLHYAPVGAGNPHFQARPLPGYDGSQSGDFTYCWES